MSNVVEFQSSRLTLLARTNTLALNTTLNRMKLRDSPVCEACPYNATEFLQHFLLEYPAYTNIRDQRIPENVDSVNVLFMYCLDFTELSPLHKLQFLIRDTYYYYSKECCDFFDRKCFKYWLKYIFNIISKLLSIFNFYIVIST